MKLKLIVATALIGACGASASHVLLAAESSAGKKLHDTYCVACHDSTIYSRENHLRSLDALEQQIGACGHNTGTQLSADEVREIAEYLNTRYYHFP